MSSRGRLVFGTLAVPGGRWTPGCLSLVLLVRVRVPVHRNGHNVAPPRQAPSWHCGKVVGALASGI
eukprot:15260188-Alexandrium_andersonii.AAC.1